MGAISTFDTAPLDGALAASILDWWHDAGVDLLVEDNPRDWMAPEPVRAPLVMPARRPPPPCRSRLRQHRFPTRWRRFLAWRLSDAAPEATWDGISLTATGPADAALMVLVDCPDRDDGDAVRFCRVRRGGCSTGCWPPWACRARPSMSPRSARGGRSREGRPPGWRRGWPRSRCTMSGLSPRAGCCCSAMRRAVPCLGPN